MNKTLIVGPKKIEKFDKKLNTAQDQLDKEREKLKEKSIGLLSLIVFRE